MAPLTKYHFNNKIIATKNIFKHCSKTVVTKKCVFADKLFKLTQNLDDSLILKGYFKLKEFWLEL